MPASETARPAGRKRLAFVVIALGASTVLALAILEAGTRWLEARGREPSTIQYLRLLEDNRNGTGSYRLRPDLDLTTPMGGRTLRVRTNSHGMPWREVEVAKSERRRIAFLGDSFTFGSWADGYESTFVGTFESAVSPERWEVLNFGVGGYGVADIELLLHEEVMAFSPTYVVVVIFTGNDFRDTFLGIDKENIIDGVAHLDDDRVRAAVPEELLSEDTTLSRPCIRESPILRGLDRFSSFRALAPFMNLENLCVDFAVNQNFTMYTFWSRHPYPETALAAKDAVIGSLKRMDSFLKSRRARLAVVTLPMSEQVHARESQGVDYDISYPQAFVKAFAREQDIPFLDLLPVLREHVIRTNERLYWKRDTHLNNRGHALVGEAVAEWFRCCVRNVRPRQLASP